MNRSDFPNRIDKRWTLFLDRDGVLNERIEDDYVRKWEDWEWMPGVLEALAKLSQVFGKVVVVTNQRGIARGLYSEKDLAAIHKQMKADVKEAGGRIDAIYHCPHDRDAGCECRKPQAGMILQAAKEHPKIDLKMAILVGDSISDMEAAQAAGIPGIFIGKMHRDLPNNVLTALPDLGTLARLLESK
jgi:D-glycero-D-manno-heptose 1,7-bisphosphate phosphatase